MMIRIIAGLSLCIIIYLEPVIIIGFKFSLLWKSILLGFVFLVAVQRLWISQLIAISYLYSFKNLLYGGLFAHFLESFMVFLQTSTIPLMLHAAATIRYKKKSLWVQSGSALSFLAATLAIINIPFLVGALPELSVGLALTAFGGDEFGYSGPFQNGHAASITLAAVGLVSIYKWNVSFDRFYKLFWLLILLISLVVLYKSLVRTGMVMMLIGVVVYLYYKHSLTWFVNMTPIFLILILCVASYVAGNERLAMRLFDGSVYERQHDEWFYIIGSGRLSMSWHNLVYLFESGPLAWLLGTGIGASKDNMELVSGIRVFSHNGFVDAITHNGIIGLSLYVVFFVLLYRFIFKYKNNGEEFYLAIGLWWAYLSFAIVQGGSRFYLDILFVLVLLNLSTKNYIKNSAASDRVLN